MLSRSDPDAVQTAELVLKVPKTDTEAGGVLVGELEGVDVGIFR